MLMFYALDSPIGRFVISVLRESPTPTLIITASWRNMSQPDGKLKQMQILGARHTKNNIKRPTDDIQIYSLIFRLC